LRRVARQRTSRWTGVGHRPDGGTFPVEVDGTRIQIAGEERILALVRDTTERQRIEQELLQAQKMEAIGLLVAGVAHELNNPLASIVAFSQLIRTDPRLPAELHHHADLLIQESNRTRRIVQNLLDFARQRPPERVPTSLPDLIDRVLDLQSYTFGPSRIEAVLDIPSDLPLVSLDRAQIQQVLINLTLNAAQAIRTKGERGTIHIKAAGLSSASRSPTTDQGSRNISTRACLCRSSRRRHPEKEPGSDCPSRSGSPPATADRSGSSRAREDEEQRSSSTCPWTITAAPRRRQRDRAPASRRPRTVVP
jgi:nitrogen-specific signal transduction histidine kinase